MKSQYRDIQSFKFFNSKLMVFAFFIALFLIPNTGFTQDGMTTVIFVRHAEKGFDEGGDPDLTEAGLKRAKKLAQILNVQTIDRIFTTPFKRTNQTVQPIADVKGIKIEEYNPFKIEEAVELISNSKGQTLLFSGHSNTIPILINKLLGKDELRLIDDDEYDNLFVLTLVNNQAKLITLKY